MSVLESKPFGLVWASENSPGEGDDLARTLAEVRAKLAEGPEVRVRLTVGNRAFGEKVLAELRGDDELFRVTVINAGAVREHGEAQAVVSSARARGWDVRLDTSRLGFWFRCEPSDGGGPRYAKSARDVEALIAGGVVAKFERDPEMSAEAIEAGILTRPGENLIETVKAARGERVTVPVELATEILELLISLGDHVGNVDPRTGIDRCRVVLALRRAWYEAQGPDTGRDARPDPCADWPAPSTADGGYTVGDALGFERPEREES